MSSLLLFSSANPKSCNVAINEEHVPLVREEIGAASAIRLYLSPEQGWL